MKKVLLAVCFGLFSGAAIADQGDSGFGIEGAVAFADLEDGARTIGQALANSSGRTVT